MSDYQAMYWFCEIIRDGVWAMGILGFLVILYACYDLYRLWKQGPDDES